MDCCTAKLGVLVFGGMVGNFCGAQFFVDFMRFAYPQKIISI